MSAAGPFLLHSVSYSGSWGQACLSLDQFLDKAAELGYDGVMLMAKRPHLSILDYNSEAARSKLRQRIEARGLTRVCVAGYTNFTADLEHSDIPQLEMQIHYVNELAKLARDLGGGIVRVFTGYENGSVPPTRQWQIVVQALREASRNAAEYGVTIGVQNHHDIAAGYEAMHDLVRAVNEPNCRALFDAWAPALHGANLTEAARKMGGMTAHTTIADYQLRPRYRYDARLVNYISDTPAVQAVPFGDGFIDYRTFLRTMREAGFSGSVAYEMCSPLLDGGEMETLDRYARRFLEYMTSEGAASARSTS